MVLKKRKKEDVVHRTVFFFYLSKLMQAANCVLFCQNPFCDEVQEGGLPNNKNDKDKAVHHMQHASARIRS